VLAKTFFRGASQVAFKAASQLARCNQIPSVVMNVILDAQQRFSGCAAGMSRECFDSGKDEAHRFTPNGRMYSHLFVQPSGIGHRL